jgi:hypothetical protein
MTKSASQRRGKPVTFRLQIGTHSDPAETHDADSGVDSCFGGDVRIGPQRRDTPPRVLLALGDGTREYRRKAKYEDLVLFELR